MEEIKEQKATQSDRLLLAIGVCRELPYELAAQVTGSASYTAALITKLKKEGMIGCRSRDGLKGYVLYEKGRRYLMENYTKQAVGLFWMGEGRSRQNRKNGCGFIGWHMPGYGFTGWGQICSGKYLFYIPAFPILSRENT